MAEKKMKLTPLVSVVIPTYNRSVMLKRAIASVQKQTYVNIELIVSDDGSTDGTEVMMWHMRKDDPRLRYIRHEKSRGANAARNSAVKVASGIFITGLDDDDEFTEDRIEKLVAAYDMKYAFVAANDIIMTPKGKKHLARQKKAVVSFHDILFQNFIGNQALIEKERVIEIGMYDESLSACQDYDLWIRLIQRFGNAKVIPEYLHIKHDDHNLSTITTSAKAFPGYFSVYKKFKNFLNISQRKTRLFHLYRLRNKALSLKTLRILVSTHKPMRLLKYYRKYSPKL